MDENVVLNDREQLEAFYTLVFTYLTEYMPKSRECSLAITKLEESMMWAFNAIEKHGVNNGEEA